MCVDGAADMGKSSARTHGQGECLPARCTPVPKVTLAVSYRLHAYVLDGIVFKDSSNSSSKRTSVSS